MKNNKGFSLVELIIVIAIMAILVGVMAPQLIKYIEKTNVSSDTQLADSVKTAITTAMMDPEVINTPNNGIPASDAVTAVSGITNGAFKDAFEEIMGCTVSEVDDQVKSSPAKNNTGDKVYFEIVGSNSVHVSIDGTDTAGKKQSHTKFTAGAIWVD